MIGVTWTAFHWRRERDLLQATLEEIKHWAMIEAMSGDNERSERAVRTGGQDCHVGWGVTRLANDDERAVGVDPRKSSASDRPPHGVLELDQSSVAAKAMLATAYFQAGHYGEYQVLKEELQQAEPVSVEDFVFRALSPGQGLEDAQRAVELFPSPFARVVRAEKRCHWAIDHSAT